MTRVRFLTPTFPDPAEVAADYAAIAARGWFSNGGPCDRELSARLATWVGPDVHASVVSSCTTGLALAVQALFDRSRPLAIVPSFTFPAGPLVLRTAGFTPVFVDIDPVSWQPRSEDAARFLERHGEQVAGILLTTTFGVADDRIGDWEQVAEHHGVPLIIDSAAGFGAEHGDGEPLGRRGTCEVFSLHATKMLSVGEGGAVTARDPELIARLDRLKNFGFDEHREVIDTGSNAKLSELSAAIGLRQLDVFAERLTKRREWVLRYQEALRPLGVSFQPGVERSAPAFVSALLPAGASRDEVQATLLAAGIETRSYYSPPVHRQPLFAEAARCEDLSVTEQLAQRMLSLPMADDLAAEVPAEVATEIDRAVHRRHAHAA